VDKPETLLTVDKIEVTYHRVVTAVQGVSMEVKRGQIVALLGNNGAGKTTTLRAISGFVGLDDALVSEGCITYRGQRTDNRQPHEVTKLGVVLVPERSKVFENLTVAENILAAVSGKKGKGQAAIAYEYFPQLVRLRRREAGYLSGGERQMLAMASALVCGPELLLVDELSLGLAPRVVSELVERLQRIRDDLGLTIVLVEQNATVALEVADYGYVMENGRVVLDGTSDRLRSHDDIREFYLGHAKGERRNYRDVKQYRRSRRWYG
jgi:branched-chain amino acid transport system ATP-binding protein